jgi:transcriptional regulator with XRE-family HTH domain
MNLKELRKKRQLTQAEMAKILQLNQPAYHRLENSESILSIKNALKLHEHFGISLDEIYGITEEEQKQGLSATIKKDITPLEEDLLEVFRTIGENLGEPAQRAFIQLGESIAKNSQ